MVQFDAPDSLQGQWGGDRETPLLPKRYAPK